MIVSSGVASHALTTEFHRLDDFPFWTAGVILRGSTRYRVAAATHATSGPSIQLIAPGTAYRLSAGSAAGPWVEVWAVFAPPAHWNALLSLPEVLPGIRSLPIAPSASGRSMLREVLQGVQLAGDAPRWRNEIVASVLERVLLLAQLGRGGGDVSGLAVDERLRAVEIAVLADPGRRWTVPLLADIGHLSASRFAHLFSLQMGLAPMRYVERARMERARELLLSTDGSVQEVAHAVGYQNALHFSARFKAINTMSPTDFRRHPRA